MGKIKVLDCTLRDGGYINNWEFGRECIKDIISNLELAKIDIIETGFLRNEEYDSDSSVFNSVEQIAEYITPKVPGILYAVMIENRNYPEMNLPEYDGKSVDIIRVTFRKNEWESARRNIIDIISKGYRVCVQSVGSAAYDDQSLLTLIHDVNEIKPYAFYIVDTLGIMYRNEMRKFFYLIDSNLSKDICLGYHSHNNLQMAFANAQEMTMLNKLRTIIIDASCYGMGRGVGNLTTELIVDYINTNIEQKYSITPILNIVDKHLMPIYAAQRWGYDLPYYLSAIVKCHPNYASYLMKKETLSIEKIEKILSLLPIDQRNEFDAELIEHLYLLMQKCDIDDSESYEELKKLISDKEAVVLGPGASISIYENRIKDIITDKIVISVNFIPQICSVDFLFISNEKRFETLLGKLSANIIATSNLTDKIKDSLIFNYSLLLGEGDACDNAGAMLIRLLRNAGARKIYLAGFDGFDVDASKNYAIETFKKAMDYNSAKKKNEDISKQLKLALGGVDYEFITPTKYIMVPIK